MNKIVIGGGCFWCLEAVFQRLKGVHSVLSGYAGGHIKNPAYREVCNGTTGHAEVIEIEFDETIISLEKLLEIFFVSHDPTTLNRQGNDVGTQYRSIVFYNSEEERLAISKVISEMAQPLWQNPIVTEVVEAEPFFPAETNHHEYYNRNKQQPYCSIVINPKISKLRKLYSELLKPEYT